MVLYLIISPENNVKNPINQFASVITGKYKIADISLGIPHQRCMLYGFPVISFCVVLLSKFYQVRIYSHFFDVRFHIIFP